MVFGFRNRRHVADDRIGRGPRRQDTNHRNGRERRNHNGTRRCAGLPSSAETATPTRSPPRMSGSPHWRAAHTCLRPPARQRRSRSCSCRAVTQPRQVPACGQQNHRSEDHDQHSQPKASRVAHVKLRSCWTTRRYRSGSATALRSGWPAGGRACQADPHGDFAQQQRQSQCGRGRSEGQISRGARTQARPASRSAGGCRRPRRIEGARRARRSRCQANVPSQERLNRTNSIAG